MVFVAAAHALLEFSPSAQEPPILHTTTSSVLSRPLNLALSSSSHLLSCILVVVRVDTHDPSAVVTLLTKHAGDCDSEGLQGHAREYATRPMAKMPCCAAAVA
jgi:hypothetical protein